jgi:serine/threonine protein kinase
MPHRWVLKEKLKSGGQAEIWLVEDITLGTEAVEKRLYPARSLLDADRANELRRFQREVRAQDGLSEHHGIMPIIGWNFEAEPPFYVMPRASQTLGDYIARNPSGLVPDITIAILDTVCDAVSYAHHRGVYHRDLKPENILNLYSRWVVGDFGLCRDATAGSTTFTQTNAGLGTWAYMAPEQYDNAHKAGPEADVFSLGRILYYMLTGKSPAPYQHLDLVPAEFRNLVAIATAELPENRYMSVDEFSRALTGSGSVGLTDMPGLEEVRPGDPLLTSSSVSSGA